MCDASAAPVGRRLLPRAPARAPLALAPADARGAREVCGSATDNAPRKESVSPLSPQRHEEERVTVITTTTTGDGETATRATGATGDDDA